MTSTKQMTCPKSPNCSRFVEEVEVEGGASYVLDANFRPYELTDIRNVRLVHRSTNRVCAVHGVAPFVRLPAFAR